MRGGVQATNVKATQEDISQWGSEGITPVQRTERLHEGNLLFPKTHVLLVGLSHREHQPATMTRDLLIGKARP